MTVGRDTPSATPKWERVAESTKRLKIDGGWLYKYDRHFENGEMVFVPDTGARVVNVTNIHKGGET